jgi:archaellum component FlaC
MADQMSVQEIARSLKDISGRLDSIDGRLDGIDGRLDGIDERLDRMDYRLDHIEGKADKGLEAFAILNDAMVRGFDAVLKRLDERVSPVELAQRQTTRRVGRLTSRKRR